MKVPNHTVSHRVQGRLKAVKRKKNELWLILLAQPKKYVGLNTMLTHSTAHFLLAVLT